MEPRKLVVVEGVYSLRPELRPHYTVTLYVDTPRERRRERLLSRSYEDVSWVEHWMASEDWYEEHERPKDHADLVVDGS